MYPYYAGPNYDYKCLSHMVVLAIYIFCRTALTYVLHVLCGFSFFPNLTRLILSVRYLYV